MARIRSVKPTFFRHEKLQELGPLSMLIFAGLWTQCDNAGRFAWKPRTLKLDILPFINFDMESELMKLAEAFFIVKYESQDEFFGVIPTFLDHQRLSGKESQEPAKYPDPPQPKAKRPRKLQESKAGSDWEATGKQSGSTGDGQESQEGNGVQERNGSLDSPAALSLRVYEFWKTLLPASTRKKDALSWIQRRLKTTEPERLVMAIAKYRGECDDQGREKKFIKECANFFGEDAAFERYLPSAEDYAANLDKARAKLLGEAA